MTVEANKKWIQRQKPLRMSEGDNTDLIQKACRDPDAFAQLYLAHYDNVFRYCLRRLFDGHAAEDVTSTVFFKVMHHLNSFDGGATDFRSWLLRIATNAVNDHLRGAKRRTEAIGKVLRNFRAESDIAIDCDQELLERKMILKQALLKLKPQYQTVITMRFFENMKLTEIAACLGKKPSTVSTWLSRAIAKLRKTLNAATNSRGSR